MAQFSRAGYGATLGWRVGLIDFLDKGDSSNPAHKYWRAVEYGSDAMVGHRLVGLWGGDTPFGEGENQQLNYFGGSNSSGDLLRAGRAALYVYFRGGTQNMDRLQAISGAKTPADARRFYFWLMMINTSVAKMPFVQGVVRRPLAARHYYQRALRTFNPMQVETDLIRAMLQEEFGKSAGSKSAMTKALRAAGNTGRTGPARRFTSDVSQYFGDISPGMITVTAGASLQDATRTSTGAFSNLQSRIREINIEMARRFQQVVVGEIESGRRRAGTNNLARLHGDVRNRYPR